MGALNKQHSEDAGCQQSCRTGWGTAQASASMRDLSSQVVDVRRQLEGDEQLRTLMAGLRGANIDDSDYAAEGVTMSLVEVPLLALLLLGHGRSLQPSPVYPYPLFNQRVADYRHHETLLAMSGQSPARAELIGQASRLLWAAGIAVVRALRGLQGLCMPLAHARILGEARGLHFTLVSPERQVVAGEDGDALPLAYDPEQIALFWSRRPVAVFTRIVQLLSIAGGFLSGFLWDLANGRLAHTEVGSPLACGAKAGHTGVPCFPKDSTYSKWEGLLPG